jgi:gamma-glutamylcyclotransferase (GGCT)/AIG2-like uncharacterized protein YtfP
VTQYLFAYGTLQPDHAAPEIAAAVEQLRPVGKGFVRGVLYDLGEYPGAVFRGAAGRRIFGTVFRLGKDEGILRKLDEYEGFDPKAPEESLFLRELHPITLTDGRTVKCWVYAYNGKPESGRELTSGRYGKTRRGSRAKREVSA